MAELTRDRGVIAGKLTRFQTFVSKIKNSHDKKEVITPESISELQKRLGDVIKLMGSFIYVHSQIAPAPGEIEKHDKYLVDFEDIYYAEVARAEVLISQLMPSFANEEVHVSTSVCSQAGSNHSGINLIKMHLPKINLVKFSGQTDSWLEFKAIFENLIHENTELSDINKLHYLKSCLIGEPSDVLKSLDFTAESYEIAWTTLLDRYDQPKQIVKNNLIAILGLKLLKQESSKDLRKMTDAIAKHVSSLLKLATTEQLFEAIIVYLVSNKLDSATNREWEKILNQNEAILPTLKEFKTFLTNHSNFLENVERRSEKSHTEKPKPMSKSFVANTASCAYCKGDHFISSCQEFVKLTPQARSSKIQLLKLCFNCFSNSHFLPKCNSKYSCRTCKAKHHSLLHVDKKVAARVQPEVNDTSEDDVVEPTQSISAICSNSQQVLLPTASAKVLDSTGIFQTVRILLDSGSQSNFISSNCSKRLNLLLQDANITVCGINESAIPVNSKCNLEVNAHNSLFKINITCLVIDRITGSVPSYNVKQDSFTIPKDVTLSDPLFHKPGEIDLLIGSPVFFQLLCIGQRRLGPNLPMLQKTHFGWVVTGPTTTSLSTQVKCHLTTSVDIQDQLAKFWEMDNYPTEKVFSVEENACETHFAENTLRNDEGRFIVKIPFKTSPTVLGDSEFIAKKRFLALERRLHANPELQVRYLAFMQEYRDLNHMTLVNPTSEISYYLPHHGVLKEDSLTTKLRVVFNGSSATTTGHSLNSLQMIGPTIQQDLFTILLRFRQHRYALSADIEKMYRQVQIDKSQRHLQRILWRSSPEEPIETYDLNTVTYGTASASYLAIRSLFQLGIDCENTSPSISAIIKNDFYVDDLLSGADSVDEARHICSELTSVLNSGCFKLRKWISNDPTVLMNVPKLDIHPGILRFGDQEHAKTLGLMWIYQTDHFMFNISELTSGKITKRTMLSEISQIFDPLGLLSPCTFTAKVFLQSLWLEKLDWDEAVPNELEKKWISYRNDLLNLNDLRIPRHVTCVEPIDVQIHGFCDASQSGYGACIYFRVTNSNNVTYINLLCSKSKVAPLKPTTIPRLELSGAALLSKLLKQVNKSLKMNVNKYVLWSDSTIVLGWLKTSPNLLKTFVCNRVADIQEHTSYAEWKHVSTKFNPADLLSRGVTPQVLKTSTLWWNGPPWLLEEESSWPKARFQNVEIPEYKNETQALVVNERIAFPFQDYSNASRLERIIAHCLRFRTNCFLPKKERKTGPLSPDELERSLKTLVKLSQLESFQEEHKQLSKGNSLKTSSQLLAFNPFLDNDNLIRVGGRLQNSEYSFNKKHPFLLSGKHFFSKLIVRREHLRLLHAGPQLLLCSLREKFWITSGRNLTKQVVHECVRCFRASPTITRPIMGNLPIERITFSHPFNVTGIDYAGPIPYKLSKGRGSKFGKAYLCLFVCFASKAIHLELVTSLSTDAFLLTLRRFIARRGKPLHIHSDNGTNFVGANSKLKDLSKFLKEHESSITETLSNQGINWHFIPAHSPHFGGLWESGVKSCKHHLKRILGNSVFTFEELCTLLCQIEAILNSRPIAPLSSDPSDLQPLTPGHFLIGRPLASLPDPDVTGIPENRLEYFQRIQQTFQHFWKRWSKEYVTELQQRTKWKQHRSELTNGSLVLIKDDNLPPFKWKLGRIIDVHPGADSVNRVATLQTNGGTLRRSFAKICPLPSVSA